MKKIKPHQAVIFTTMCRLCKSKFTIDGRETLLKRKEEFCPICHVWPGNMVILKKDIYI